MERLFQRVKDQKSAEEWIRALGSYPTNPFKLLGALVRKERPLFSWAPVRQKPEPLLIEKQREQTHEVIQKFEEPYPESLTSERSAWNDPEGRRAGSLISFVDGYLDKNFF